MTATPKYDRAAALAMQSYEVVFDDNDVALVTAESLDNALAMLRAAVGRVDELERSLQWSNCLANSRQQEINNLLRCRDDN